MRFEPTLTFGRSRGRSGTVLTATEGQADTAALGRIVRSDIAARAPHPTDMTAVFVNLLRTQRSRWPAAGITGNRGPWATNRSALAFFGQQGRTATGQFQPWMLLNRARNEKGRPYANYVDQGINAGPARRIANERAVERTWTQNLGTLLRQALRLKQRRQS